MAFDGKRALALIDNLRLTAEALQAMPDMVPIAREILSPAFEIRESRTPTVKGAPPSTRRPLTAAERKRRSLQAKKRWRLAKKAGKNTIGGGE